MQKVKLSLVVLRTKQVDELIRFYSSLGIEMMQEQHGTGPVHFAGDLDGTVFEIYPISDNGAEPDSAIRLGFFVDNVADVMESLQTIGTKVVHEPKTTQFGYRALVKDPDGRSVEINQKMSHVNQTQS